MEQLPPDVFHKILASREKGAVRPVLDVRDLLRLGCGSRACSRLASSARLPALVFPHSFAPVAESPSLLRQHCASVRDVFIDTDVFARHAPRMTAEIEAIPHPFRLHLTGIRRVGLVTFHLPTTANLAEIVLPDETVTNFSYPRGHLSRNLERNVTMGGALHWAMYEALTSCADRLFNTRWSRLYIHPTGSMRHPDDRAQSEQFTLTLLERTLAPIVVFTGIVSWVHHGGQAVALAHNPHVERMELFELTLEQLGVNPLVAFLTSAFAGAGAFPKGFAVTAGFKGEIEHARHMNAATGAALVVAIQQSALEVGGELVFSLDRLEWPRGLLAAVLSFVGRRPRIRALTLTCHVNADEASSDSYLVLPASIEVVSVRFPRPNLAATLANASLASATHVTVATFYGLGSIPQDHFQEDLRAATRALLLGAPRLVRLSISTDGPEVNSLGFIVRGIVDAMAAGHGLRELALKYWYHHHVDTPVRYDLLRAIRDGLRLGFEHRVSVRVQFVADLGPSVYGILNPMNEGCIDLMHDSL